MRHQALLTIAIMIGSSARLNAQYEDSLRQQDIDLRAFAKPILDVATKSGKSMFVSWPVYNQLGNRFVSSYFFGAADATPSKAYFALDNADGRISLGYTLPVERSDKQLKALWSFGAKANVSEGFAPVAKEGKGLQEDLGLSVKFTFFGNTALGYRKVNTAQVRRLGVYHAGMQSEDLEDWIADDRKHREVKSLEDLEERKKDYEAKAEELADELTEKLSGAIEDKPLYGSMWNWWVNAEAYCPVSQSTIQTADSATQANSVERSTLPFTFTVQYVMAKKWAKGQSILFSVGFSAINNNSALAQELETTPFQSLLSRPGNDTTQVAMVNSEDVYVVKDYNTFISPAFEVGVVGGPFGCAPWLRFRLSVQQYLPTDGNEYTPTIWSLGLPLSLKDEEGDPKVNIEPQVRWLNGEHSIGFSLGVPLIGSVE
jgi:hypothetical protein